MLLFLEKNQLKFWDNIVLQNMFDALKYFFDEVYC